jgi:hypothetical protein
MSASKCAFGSMKSATRRKQHKPLCVSVESSVMTDQLDLFKAKANRDEGMARVEENAGPTFTDAALDAIAKLPRDFVGPAEDIRIKLTEMGIVPHHPNAWGALTAHALRRKLIAPTGDMTHMRSVKSNARRTPVYRMVG